MAFTNETINLPSNYYSATVSDPVAINALQRRAAVTTLLSQNPALGGQFVMTPIDHKGYKWQNARYNLYLEIASEEDFNWQNIAPGEDHPGFDITFEKRNVAVTAPQFQEAINAVKSILQNPVLPAGMGGKRHRRKSKKHTKKHRSTRRR